VAIAREPGSSSTLGASCCLRTPYYPKIQHKYGSAWDERYEMAQRVAFVILFVAAITAGCGSNSPTAASSAGTVYRQGTLTIVSYR
jgi:hypothetical protein